MIYGEWSSADDDGKIQQFTDATLESLEKEARETGIFYPFIFLNDAGIQQDPIATYGYGASPAKMMAVAKKYDPMAVFQRNVPGFKIKGEAHAC